MSLELDNTPDRKSNPAAGSGNSAVDKALDSDVDLAIEGIATETGARNSLKTDLARDYFRAHRANATRRLVWVIVGAVVIIGFPIVLGGNKEWLSVAVFGLIASIGALGMNVLTGYTGQASFGHGFFLGVGAYTAAVFGGSSPAGSGVIGLGLPFYLWIPLAGLVAGLIGLIVGPLALRLKGLYLALATVSLVFIGLHLFSNLKDITGGANGRQFPAPTLGDLNFSTGGQVGPFTLTRDQLYYFLAVIILVLCAVFIRNVMKSRAGRAFMAVRDREIAAELIGINLAWTKVTAFVFSSALAGMAGALYGSYLRYSEPELWGLNLSIQFTAMIIIGGVGSVSGSIVGALLLTALPQLIQILTGSNPWNANLVPFVSTEATGLTVSLFNQLLYAVFLILFLLFEPQGFVGIYRRLAYRVRLLFARKEAQA
ncbi:MAG: branched-chain amino acid ABC transporter permease [Chloroflexi bacterium]|nr:branched-chain amino acid ABC transporter permease [Chloroflexota bacterium]